MSLELATEGSKWALVLDADRTLASVDTGRAVGEHFGMNLRIRHMFQELGYTQAAFATHASFWSEIPAPAFVDAVDAVADQVVLHDVWLDVLASGLAPTVVVTAGIPLVWRRVLVRYGIHVPVLGGLHSHFDSYFVTPDCKAWVVAELQRRGLRIIAAGDSEIDLPMLKAADVPLWVPDKKGSPRLRARLGELPIARQVAVDERRFGDRSPLRAADIAAIVQGDSV